MDVRSAIQGIAVEHRRRYGYRRSTAALRRRGLLVTHKRVARLMREDNLLAVQPRAVVITTDAQHDLQVFLNLASRLTLTGINQLRVADITYIRLRAEFVYLAVRLDAYSRKVVGWALDRTLAANLQPDSSAQCAGLSTTRTGKHRAAMRLTHIAAGTITGGRSDGVKKFNISGVLFNI